MRSTTSCWPASIWSAAARRPPRSARSPIPEPSQPRFAGDATPPGANAATAGRPCGRKTQGQQPASARFPCSPCESATRIFDGLLPFFSLHFDIMMTMDTPGLIETWTHYCITHRWSSGRILPCHGRDPGSIPGRCMQCTKLFLHDFWPFTGKEAR